MFLHPEKLCCTFLGFFLAGPRIKAPVKFAMKTIPREKVLTISYVFIPGDLWVLTGWLCHSCHRNKSTVSNTIFMDDAEWLEAITVLSRLLGHDSNPDPSSLTLWVSSALWASISCTVWTWGVKSTFPPLALRSKPRFQYQQKFLCFSSLNKKCILWEAKNANNNGWAECLLEAGAHASAETMLLCIASGSFDRLQREQKKRSPWPLVIAA